MTGRRTPRARLRRRPLALAAFVLLALLAAALMLRAVMVVVHMGGPAPAGLPPLEGWMTPRYVARIAGLPPEAMQQVLDLPAGDGRRVTLAEIAAARGEPLEAFLARIGAALDRIASGGDSGDDAGAGAGAGDAP